MLKEYKKLYTLLSIAKLIEDGRMHISTREFSKAIGVSHQSASRYLKELEREKLIETVMTPGGRVIKLSGKGLEQIRTHIGALISMVSKIDKEHVFTGRVFTGLGEGAYYASRKPYLEQFYMKLGFYPYPGTLNLRIESYMDILLLADRTTKPLVFIKGFVDHERAFGDVYCFPVSVNNTYEGAVIRALRTLYDSSVVEIISPHNLRKKLKLKDGDRVSFVFKEASSK
ncbi:MAG: DUF120 domain-containing protein [Thermoproteota archaeon]